jgi:hypothetical protein
MKTILFGSVAAFVTAGLALAREPAAPPTGTPVPVESSILSDPDPLVPPEGLSLAAQARRDDKRLWESGEYLLWWFKKSPEPVPLATQFPPGAVAAPGQAPPGAIGGPDTSVLIGGQAIDTEAHSGFRFTGGYWLDDDRTWAIEGDYLYLAREGNVQSVSMSGRPGTPQIQVPFFDVTGFGLKGVPGEAVSFFIAPGNPESGMRTLTLSNRLEGAELNGDYNLVHGDGLRVDLLGGVRWFQVREDLNFLFTELAIPPSRQAGAFSDHLDSFVTENNFYAGQLGVREDYVWGSFFANTTAKIGLGDMTEVVNITGVTQTTVITGQLAKTFVGVPVQTLGGGFFAQASNEGHHSTDRFAVLGEVDVQAGYQPVAWARMFVGYSFLGVSSVARPGDEINHDINVSRQAQPATAAAAHLPTPQQPNGPEEPSFTFHSSDFWAQGINVGLEFRY